MTIGNGIKGEAALAISESLLLCLGDLKILREDEIIGILKDAISAHLNAPADYGQSDIHKKAAALIQSIIDGGNSVRRPAQ